MSNPDQLSEKFTTLSPEEAKAVLTEAAISHGSTILWRKNEDPRIETYIYQYIEKSETLLVRAPKFNNPRELQDFLYKDNEIEFYFSVSLSRALYFFKCTLKSFAPTKLEFLKPKEIFKVQRRQELRLTNTVNPNLWIEFQDPQNPEDKMLRKLADVSSGGLAILIEKESASLFAPEQVLKNFKIILDFEVMVEEAKVVHIKEMPSTDPSTKTDEEIKIGMIFTKISPQVTQALQSFVFAETRRHFSKFM